MTLVYAALVAGASSILVASLSLVPVRRRLSECERERVQTRQLLVLFVGAIVGVVPEAERLRLLEATAELQVEMMGRRAD